ncbi:hypothetical protein [Stakelama marina]|uniref:Uncharacterized protein n=1 Tax=Stakelama marina TaxID=2826939 RepID=A0A8T4I9S2_9SPHN|nr:hypothetical protein [Stakelama marina]MBR0551121.1 hypothetical protein [Stakelama marina]
MSETTPSEARQTMQRVRVGMTGLALILVLIGLGSAIFTSANDEGAVEAVGASNEQVVANMAAPPNATDTAETTAPDEPLAELGVAPSVTAVEPANAAKIASQISAEKQKDSSKVH